MMAQEKRDKVLLVGGTGSLGKEIIPEFRNQRIAFRVLGRSWQSFDTAGFLQQNDLDLVVCDDVTDPDAYDRAWFQDIKLIVTVARPKSLRDPEERTAYLGLIKNLSDLACECNVPRMLLLGKPYAKDETVQQELSSAGYSIEPYLQSEEYAKQRFRRSPGSSLTIARLAEMSEAGFIFDAAKKYGVWICIRGRNPRLQFISSRDFALAVCMFAKDDERKQDEFLVCGPGIVTWREFGALVSEITGTHLRTIDVPLSLLQCLIAACRGAGIVFPPLQKLAFTMTMLSVAMRTDTVSEQHEVVGSVRLEDFLRNQAQRQQHE